MQKWVIVGFLFSLLIVIFLGLFFTLSNKNFYLGQISSSLKNFENLNSEIQNLKKEISNLRGEIENEKKEREEIKEEVLSFSQNFQTQVKNVKEKIEKPKEVTICQKRENDFPRHRVIFNEICWMGDEESPTNEWIEIKNISKEEIDLSGWQILNKNQKLKFVFEEGAKILPSEILLLKRGDDFSGAIKNSDEALFLFDKNCNLEDEVFATSSWPAGDNFSKRTAERKNDLFWQTSLDPGGTPGRENSPGFVEIEKEEEKEPKISLSFPKEVFANQEFKVSLSVSDLENETYDIKISILKISDESEQKRTISEISLTGDEWQNSYNYLQKVFTGTSFSGDFKLRISQKYQDFKGEAEILAKVRESSNKKVVGNFEGRINILSIAKEEVSKEVSTSQEISSNEPNTVSIVSNNLLKNEFFGEWDQNIPTYWKWDKKISDISCSTDSLVGKCSVEVILNSSDANFYQYGIEMDENTTYYAEVWVKGKGMVKLGIKYPSATSSYVYYGEEVKIDTDQWIKISLSRKPSNSGTEGGMRLKVWYDESKNIPKGSKLLIGAAWLGETPPPANWPK